MKPNAQATIEQFADFYIRNIYYSYFAEKGGWDILGKLFERLLN